MTDRGVQVDGPPGAPFLVLSNSLGTTAEMWQPQMSVLTSRFRVVRYEHRGHGRTATPAGGYSIADLGHDLLGVLDTVGAERASLMGLSLGGTTAMWVAVHRPERVERMVLACTRPAWPPAELWDERVSAMSTGSPVDLLDRLVTRWFTPEYREQQPGSEQSVASMLGGCSSDGYARCCVALREVDLTPHLGEIRAPTLVVAGGSDPAVPIGSAAALAESIPGAELRVISPGAHLLNVEQSERFNAAVLDHLAGYPLERGRATRRAVLGDQHVERSEKAVGALTAPFSDLITRYAWGDVWTRAGLDRRTRSAVTLAMLVALGRFDELELHLQGARRNGLSHDEIGEVLLQAAVYCGVPAANTAYAVARRVLGWDSPNGGPV